MNLCAIIGIDEAVRLVANEFNKFAAPGKLPNRTERYENLKRVHNVEVWFDMENEGVARFHGVTWDNIEFDVAVDFTELDREYLDEKIHSVKVEINKHRAKRKPIVLH